MTEHGRVHQLPGSKLSAKTVLGRTLAKCDRIQNVFVAIQWDDDSWSHDWSQMRVSDLCMAQVSTDRRIGGIIMGYAYDADSDAYENLVVIDESEPSADDPRIDNQGEPMDENA